MKRSTWKKRALASALALTMAASVLPTAGFAAGGSGTGTPLADTGDLVLNKTAKLENDGTYTINLEAYATGEVISTVSTTPLDIVLLLDVSGSMEKYDMTTTTDEDNYTLYTGPVKNAYSDPTLRHKCPDGTYHQIRWTDTSFGLMTRYRFYCDYCGYTRKDDVWFNANDPVAEDWQLYSNGGEIISRMEALKYSVDNFIDGVAERNAALTDPNQRHRISLVKFAGNEKNTVGDDWYSEYGNQYNYTQIVKNLTTVDAAGAANLKAAVDGLEPGGATSADYGMNRAAAALEKSDDGRNKVIILFSDGEPTHGNEFENSVANRAILKAYEQKNNQRVLMYSVAVVSGANPNDTTLDINKFFHGMSSNYPDAQSLSDLGTGGNNGYYKSAADADQLNNIFEEIKEDITTTDVTLDANAVLKDIMAEGFEVPDSAQVTAQVVPCTGRDQNGVYLWGTPQSLAGAKIDVQGKRAVSVSGFNYKDNCVVTGKFNEDTNQYECTGQKLVVTIKGIEALDAVATGEPVYTNAAESGIYENADAKTPVAVFNRPQTIVNSELYVLDYAKTAVLTNEGQTTRTTLDADGMHKFTATTTQISEKYGKAEITADGLTYTPTKMNWDGYDTFYSFGRNNNGNVWSKISVMPANNVYYEDDFVTNIEYGTVGIEYSKDNWEIVYDNGQNQGNDNTETPNNDIHGGWVPGDTGLSDDTGYSDGSAHVSTEKKATASFTFTGTGVDVYTYTNSETLNVIARITGESKEGKKVDKLLIMNNKSESGAYYQIPTLSFTGLDYGTYTVTLTVAGNGIYYLDGIRVYNPIQGLEEDELVKKAYGDEAGAMFQSVRDILVDNESLTGGAETATGVVFLDKDENGTNDIGTYKDYGPKNEVYLAKGQSIGFQLNNLQGAVYIGLKAPEGKPTSVQLTNGNGTSEQEIKHSTDLYYKITPNDDGLVVIKNTGDSLLSITKLRTTGNSGVGEMDLASLMSYVAEMDTLPEVPYVDEDSDGSEDGGNVDIENPDQGQETPNQGNAFLDILKDIFESIWNWF